MTLLQPLSEAPSVNRAYTSGSIVEFAERLDTRIVGCDELSEEKMWSQHGTTTIWKTSRFVGSPHFYPVYAYRDLYSYSPLPLILYKGSLRLNQGATRKMSRNDWLYLSGKATIDREVRRKGGPLKTACEIKDSNEYEQLLADAMVRDAAATEEAHPGFTNIVMCGGKDSLNLLLLPWKNPVVAASAAPNYELVKAFVKGNGLKFETILLEDDDRSLIDLEILVNCCMRNLEHARWGPQLLRLSEAQGGRVIFWKGQLGAYMKPSWRGYYPHERARLYSLISRSGTFKRLFERSGLAQRLFFMTLWYRGAMWQGTHMAFIRLLTGSLVLSGYHGPALKKVVSRVDLSRAVTEDIRPRIGKILHGAEVLYPAQNPSPPSSMIRRGISGPEPLLRALQALGIAIDDRPS